MISMLRKSFKTRLYKIILWITILATGGVFSVFELIRLIIGGSTNKWVVKVNGHAIDSDMFARKVADEQERMRMIRAQYGPYADMIFQMIHASSDPEVAALDSVIREELLNESAQKLSLAIAPDYVQEKLKDLMFIQKELSDIVPMYVLEAPGVVNMRALRIHLQRTGMSMETFNELVAQAIKRHVLAQLVGAADYVPLFELKRKFIKDYVPKKYSIKTITMASMITEVSKETVTDKQLQAFYDQQNAQAKKYVVPERRSAILWTFDPSSYGITVTDADIEDYYQKNKSRNYVQSPAQVHVRHILFKIDDPAKAEQIRIKAETIRAELVQHPEQFAKKAKEVSEDKESAAKGGELAFFAKGERPEAFERAAFVLKADNDISPVISTPQGLEILQRMGKKAIAYKPLSAVKNDIRALVETQKFAERFAHDARALLHGQQVTQEIIATFAQSKQGKKKEVKEQSNDGAALAKTLFKLKPNEAAYYQEGSQGVIVFATTIKEATIPALASVKDKVVADYYKQQAQTLLEKRLAALEKQACLEPLTGTGVEHTGFIKKDDAQQVAALEKQGLPVQKMFQLENIGAVTTARSPESGSVIRVNEVGAVDEALFDKEKNKIKQELMQQRATFLMSGFIASFWRSAKIDKNESLLHLKS